ncbi:MAG: NAD(P)H-quinone oxidoreductase [Methylococcales bacterium]|nr:NAD(P)H-quinone oxidoreductase [Methylococcales bacterium]
MQAILIDQPGPAEHLQLGHRPTPEPDVGQVRIKVACAGVNRPDVMQRKGLYPPPPGASDILGLEVSGVVDALGPGVTGLPSGQPVCALVTGGGYAQYCLAEAPLCLPIPDNVSFAEAAGLPEALFTVWSNLWQRAAIQPGETLLVHGGAGGLGHIALQLARAFDLRAITTCGGEEKCRFALKQGAFAAIDYRRLDFVQEVQTLTEGRGVDVVLDIVGGDYLNKNLTCLADEGRLLQIAVQQGPKTDINLLPILLRRLTLTGSTLRARPVAFKAAIAQALLSQVWPLLACGQIKPYIHCLLPLADAGRAHELMEAGRHRGKIILNVNSKS